MKFLCVAVCFAVVAVSVAMDNSPSSADKAREASEQIRAYSQKLLNSLSVSNRSKPYKPALQSEHSVGCGEQYNGIINEIQKRNEREMLECTYNADYKRIKHLTDSENKTKSLVEDAYKVQNDIMKCSEVKNDPIKSFTCYSLMDVETAAPVRDISSRANTELMKSKTAELEISMEEEICMRKSVNSAMDDTNAEYDKIKQCLNDHWGSF